MLHKHILFRIVMLLEMVRDENVHIFCMYVASGKKY